MTHHSRNFFPRLILRSFCLILAFFLAGLIPAIAREEAPANDARLIEALKSFIPHVMRQVGTPGLNIALARRGKVIWEEGFGYANLEKKTPMTPQTVMRSGSMGKTYTATAVMQLVEQGVIGLFDPINKYLKEFQVINPLGEREITFHDLLTHRGGLSSNDAGSDFLPPKPLGQSLKEDYGKKMFKIYEGTVVPRWSSKVGEKFQYSNFGIATLGYLVEVTNPEKLSFSEYQQKHIIDPLGMTSTQYPPVQDAAHVRPDIFARVSTGYAQFGPVDIPTPDIFFADFPAGAVVTTPGDHIRLLLAYLNQGNYNGYQLLKPETVRLMLSPRVDAGSGSAVGLVWVLKNLNKPDYNFQHGGAHMYGWNNEFRAYPDQDFAIVVATNHWNVPNPAERGAKRESQLICDFISSWLMREKANYRRTQPAASWAWKTSYVIGLMIVDSTKGGLGIESPITPEMIEAMAVKAKVRTEAENGASVWDPAGFRAGVKDMMSIRMIPAAIKAFLESERLQVAPEELDIIFRELGGSGSFRAFSP